MRHRLNEHLSEDFYQSIINIGRAAELARIIEIIDANIIVEEAGIKGAAEANNVDVVKMCSHNIMTLRLLKRSLQGDWL